MGRWVWDLNNGCVCWQGSERVEICCMERVQHYLAATERVEIVGHIINLRVRIRVRIRMRMGQDQD